MDVLFTTAQIDARGARRSIAAITLPAARGGRSHHVLTSLAEIYPFERFDEQMTALDSLLKLDGFLVVHHAQYLVENATVGSRYAPLAGVPPVADGGPKFGRGSERIESPAEMRSIFVEAETSTS